MTTTADPGALAGLLLAAGAGRRMGGPKALVPAGDGRPWVVHAASDLVAAGCVPVAVVVGAAAQEAELALRSDPATAGVDVVLAEEWEQGMGHSLRAGLEHLQQHTRAAAALVMLVDLPDVGPPVLTRVSAQWGASDDPGAALLRASYDARPGHPVVLGRDHWTPLLASLHGDEGAQSYLTREDVRRRVEVVECADLATGRDVDRRPEDPE